MGDPFETGDLMATLGVEPMGETLEEFGATVLRDRARWSEVIKRGGITPQ